MTGLQRGWWLEDAVVGTTLVHPGGRTIGRDEHPMFAWLTNNGSEVHGNADRAASTAFGEPLVLGALSAAIVVGLAAPAVGPPATAGRAMPVGWRRINLISTVLAGTTLRAFSTIRAVTRDPDGAGGSVEREVVGRDQRGEVVVVIEERCWAAARLPPTLGPASVR